MESGRSFTNLPSEIPTVAYQWTAISTRILLFTSSLSASRCSTSSTSSFPVFSSPSWLPWSTSCLQTVSYLILSVHFHFANFFARTACKCRFALKVRLTMSHCSSSPICQTSRNQPQPYSISRLGLTLWQPLKAHTTFCTVMLCHTKVVFVRYMTTIQLQYSRLYVHISWRRTSYLWIGRCISHCCVFV